MGMGQVDFLQLQVAHVDLKQSSIYLSSSIKYCRVQPVLQPLNGLLRMRIKVFSMHST